MSCRFFPIVEGDLYRSGALRPRRLERLVRRHGIRAVIDLRSPRSAVRTERAMLAGIGVAYYNVPSKQRPRADTVEAVLALVDRPENRPLLIHCQHGVRRAAQFEAILAGSRVPPELRAAACPGPCAHVRQRNRYVRRVHGAV